jgi:hypothetical protein
VQHEILLEIDGHVIARLGDVLVQVRDAPMTEEVLSAIDVIVRNNLLGSTKERAFAYVVAVGPGFEIPPASIRRRQKAFIERTLARANARVVIVVDGDDARSAIARAFARLLLPGKGDVSVVGTVAEACARVRAHVPDVEPKALALAIEDARARAVSKNTR